MLLYSKLHKMGEPLVKVSSIYSINDAFIIKNISNKLKPKTNKTKI